MKYKLANERKEEVVIDVDFDELTDTIDLVEEYQSGCISDSSEFYKSLERIKVKLYEEYVKRYKENNDE